MLTHIIYRKAFRSAIFTICGSRNPSLACLADIGERAAQIARRSKPWGARTLYVCLHLDRYEHHNNGAVKYGIGQELYDAIMHLAGSDVARGKQVVKVYAHGVREGAIVLGHSRRCARRRCGIHFVGAPGRLYCSDHCAHLVELARRKRQAQERRQVKLMRRRKGQRARSQKK